jgi:hypothetical protein
MIVSVRSVGSRCKALAARALSAVAAVRLTAAYAAALAAVSVLLMAAGPKTRDSVVAKMSTNLHNLASGHLSTLVGSAFISAGGHVFIWLPGMVCLLALGELIWDSRGLLVTFAVGHIGATLIVAVWLATAVNAGWLPMSIADATDVGISYGAVCVLGALTTSLPSRWQAAWIGWWLGIAALAASGADFTAIGHVVALLLGAGVSFRLDSAWHWTPMRTALLAGAFGFGYLLVAGSVLAPLAGLAGALIAVSISWFLRRRSAAQEPGGKADQTPRGVKPGDVAVWR